MKCKYIPIDVWRAIFSYLPLKHTIAAGPVTKEVQLLALTIVRKTKIVNVNEIKREHISNMAMQLPTLYPHATKLIWPLHATPVDFPAMAYALQHMNNLNTLIVNTLEGFSSKVSYPQVKALIVLDGNFNASSIHQAFPNLRRMQTGLKTNKSDYFVRLRCRVARGFDLEDAEYLLPWLEQTIGVINPQFNITGIPGTSVITAAYSIYSSYPEMYAHLLPYLSYLYMRNYDNLNQTDHLTLVDIASIEELKDYNQYEPEYHRFQMNEMEEDLEEDFEEETAESKSDQSVAGPSKKKRRKQKKADAPTVPKPPKKKRGRGPSKAAKRKAKRLKLMLQTE